MGKLIVGIVVDVLSHVGIEHHKRCGVSWIATATPARKLVVLNSRKLVVLDPKISFKNFRCRRKPEQSSISFRKTTAVFFKVGGPKNPRL